MRNDDDVIVLSGLTKLYEPTPRWMRVFARSHLRETVRALDGVDLVVRAGEICAVVGPNGAGKTTMFRIIVGLTSPTSGTGSVLGLDVERDSEQIRQVVGWMPSEDRSLLMRATSAENLQLHGRLQGMPRKELAERIPYVLETVNLTPQTHTVVAGLSAGMRARPAAGPGAAAGPACADPRRTHRPGRPDRRVRPAHADHGSRQAGAARGAHLLAPAGGDRGAAVATRCSSTVERSSTPATSTACARSGSVRRLEFVAIDHQAAGAIADGLLSQGIESTVDELSVRCRPTGQERLGTILGRLGPADDQHRARPGDTDAIARPHRPGVLAWGRQVTREPRLSRCHASPRSFGRKVLDTVEGYVRIDLVEERMFPATSIMRYLAVVFPVLLYYFQGSFLQITDQLFVMMIVGTAVIAGLQDALTALTSRLNFAMERGTLETYLVEPVPWALIPVAMNVWRSFTGALLACFMVAIGWLLGAPIEASGIPLALVVLFLGIVACNALGSFAAAFIVLFKRGEPVVMLFSLATAVLGGALFPINVLPEWIRWASYLVPHTYVISAARQLLIADAPTGRAVDRMVDRDPRGVLGRAAGGRCVRVRPLTQTRPQVGHSEHLRA